MGAQQALPGAEDAVTRDPLDFNRTQAWVVQLLVPHLGAPRAVLDVGCGDGAIGRVLRHAWPEAHIEGVELDAARAARAAEATAPDGRRVYGKAVNLVWQGCWIDCPWTGHDLIISNPPFGLTALAFLRHAAARVAPGGTVAFLLPTHWDHDPDVESDETSEVVDGKAQKRAKFARQRFLDSLRLPDGREGYCKLAIVGGGPYPARPSFKKGGTASDRYAWFLFGERWAGQPSRRIHALPPEEPTGQLDLLGGGA